MSKESLTLREAADLLRMSHLTLRTWLYEGRLPFYRMGRARGKRGKILIDLSDIESYKRKCRVESRERSSP